MVTKNYLKINDYLFTATWTSIPIGKWLLLASEPPKHPKAACPVHKWLLPPATSNKKGHVSPSLLRSLEIGKPKGLSVGNVYPTRRSSSGCVSGRIRLMTVTSAAKKPKTKGKL